MVAAVAVSAAVVGPALAIPPTQASAALPGVVRIGRLDLTSPCYQSTASGIDRAVGVMVVLQVANGGSPGCATAQAMVFRSFSLASSRVLAERVPALPVGLSPRLDARRLTMDEVHHRLYVYFISQTPSSPNHILSFSTSDVIQGHGAITPLADISVLGIPAAAGSASPANLVPTRNPTGPVGDYDIVPTGMTYDPAGDDLYVLLAQFWGGATSLTSAHGSGANDEYVARLHIPDAAVAWLLPLDQCVYSPKLTTAANRFQTDDPIALVRQAGRSTIYAGCIFSRAPSYPAAQQLNATIPLGGSMLSYAIPLDAGSNPLSGGVSYSIGRNGALGGIADPESGRLFWASIPPYQQGANSGPAAVVFDGTHRAYIGAPTVAGPADLEGQFMMAVGGGRYYSFSRAGITVGDATATPPGQGVLVSGFSCPVVSAAVDPSTKRLFTQEVSDCANTSSTAKPYIDVFQDQLPSISPQVSINPDSYTKQVNEESGVTTAQFNAHAEATGSRLRLVGGPAGFVSGATFGAYDLVFGPNGLGSSVPPLPVTLDGTSRELSLGVVHQSNLDNYQASSNAISSSADDATAQQVAGNQLVPQWPFKEINCSDPGSKQAGTNDSPDTGATVSCDDGARTTSAASAAGPFGLGVKLTGQTASQSLPLSVAQSVTSTHVWMDPAAGVVSESHAIARGIDLGVVTINQVESDLRCQAHGRIGTAKCVYTRLISGAASGGAPVGGGACIETDGPTGTVGSCSTLLGALNGIEPGQIIFATPDPDGSPNTFRGSPGGYQSVGKRELYEHLQDDVVNYDSSSQVPGLEVTYVNDSSFQPSRLDLQLSDTEAEAHYGIQPAVSSDLGPTDNGPVDTSSPLPLVAQIVPPAPPADSGSGLWHLITRALQRVFDGISVLLRSPVTGLVVAALLLMMASPLGIAWRRRCLLIALSGG
jgi:hypothetical protein